MTSPTKFYYMTQIILQMLSSCDKSFVTLPVLWEKLLWPLFYKDLTRKTKFLEECSWFKFNNMGLAPSMALKFYTDVAKGLKLKVRKFWELIPTFAEVTGGTLAWGTFAPSWIGLTDKKNYKDLIIYFTTILLIIF